MSAPEWRLPPMAADDRPTYLAHALALSALHGSMPWPNGGGPLPDAKPPAVEGSMVISDAVMDGIRTHHMAAGGVQAVDAGRLADMVEALVRRAPSLEALQSLHDAAAAVSPVRVA